MFHFFKTLKVQRQPFAVYIIIMLTLAAVVALTTVLFARLTGELSQAALAQNNELLMHTIWLLTGVFAIRAISSAISTLLMWTFFAKADYRFRTNFAKTFLRKPFSGFQEANGGEAMSVYSNDLPGAVSLVCVSVVRMISDVFTLVASVVYMFILSVSLSTIFFVAFPVLIVLQGLVSKPIQKKQIKISEARANFVAVANDSFQNTSTIAAYSLEDFMQSRCKNSFANVISATKEFILAMVPLVLGGMVATFTPLFIIIVITAGRVINGSFSFGEFVVFTGLASQAGGWLSMLSQQLTGVQTNAGGAKRLLTTLEGEEENLVIGTSLNPNISGDMAIDVQGITFAYPTKANKEDIAQLVDVDGVTTTEVPTLALNNITFEIRRGERVAFVGGSGSGKSTMLKLLMGLYPPDSGIINILGQDVASLSLESLRSAFAYVPQDSFLFPISIGANITGEDGITDISRLEKACKDAGILDFIKTLPSGFDAQLSEAGENISGGQKQRIALARALYRNAPVLLFDEATSALDPATEAAILNSVYRLNRDTTVIMVSHRVKPIVFCDTIVVMDSGRVVSIGTHQHLIENCAVYKKLYDWQSLSEEVKEGLPISSESGVTSHLEEVQHD